MPENDTGDTLLLPPGTRLLYIGPPKTGTTSVQQAAAQARPALREHGVCYPGATLNHRRAIYALMNRADGPAGGMTRGLPQSSAMQVPPISLWRDLVAEIDAQPEFRSLISNEVAAGADEAMIRTFLDELGPEKTHVAISLRSPLSLLPARWVELVKSGESITLDDWLQRAYGRSAESIPEAMRRYLDMGGLVERWARIVGPQNVTVVIGDKANKSLLTDTFEELLGLPANTLTGTVTRGDQTNRSMSAIEAEIVREVNAKIFVRGKTSWPLYLDVIRTGVVRHLLGGRHPDQDEPRVQMPPWAAELAVADGKRYAAQITESGVRVAGSLSNLYQDAPPRAEGDTVHKTSTYAIAVAGLVGAWQGATLAEADAVRRIDTAEKAARQAQAERDSARAERDGAQAKLDRAQRTISQLNHRSIYRQVQGLSPERRAERAASSFTTHDLARALSIRLRHKIRTRRSMGLK